jgi:GNAT superfamily N-acetyltransferase
LPAPDLVRSRLNDHLRLWLGATPEPGAPRLVVTSERDVPGWDGAVRPIQGISGPDGIVLAVSPRYGDLFTGIDLEALFLAAGSADARESMQRLLGLETGFGMPVFRWCEQAPSARRDTGEWVEPADPRIPDWLRPFNGGILVSFDAHGRYRAGVGLKRHNHLAREISVGTDPRHRGQGLATRLVAQAARTIIAEGGVPLYQHSGDNRASARVADSAGFPDRGWHMLEIRPDWSGTVRG